MDPREVIIEIAVEGLARHAIARAKVKLREEREGVSLRNRVIEPESD